MLAPDERHRAGAYFTRRPIADGLTRLALAACETGAEPPHVCDPAVGGGAFLLAAGRRLAASGVDPATVVGGCLWGADLDPLTVAVAEAALHLWSAVRGSPVASTNLVVGDTLADEPRGVARGA